MKVLVAYDGTLQAKKALKYGVEKVRENGGEVVALHVFDTNLFIGYDSLPWAIDRARREAMQFVEEGRELASRIGDGVRVRFEVLEGDPEDEILDYATRRRSEVLLCPPRYSRIINEYKKLLTRDGKKVFEGSIMDGADTLKMSMVASQ